MRQVPLKRSNKKAASSRYGLGFALGDKKRAAHRNTMKRYSAKAALEREQERLVEELS